MLKKNPVFLILLAAVLTCGAGDKIRTRIAIPLSEQKQVKVEVDQSNVTRQARFSPLKITASSGSLAGRLGAPAEELLWRPALDPASSKLRLKSITQSPDRSIIAFLEETGRDPYASRLILFNTADWFFCRIFELPRRICDLVIDAKTATAAFSAMEQSAMNETNGVGILNLQTGTQTLFIPLEKTPEQIAWSSHVNNIFAIFPDDGSVYQISRKKQTVIKNVSGVSLLSISPDGFTVVAVSDSKLYRISVLDGTVFSETELPDPCKPYAITFPENSGKKILLSRVLPGSQTTGLRCSVLLISDRSVRLVCKGFSGKIAAAPGHQFCYAEQFVRSRVSKFSLTDFKELSYCSPIQMRPYSHGQLRALFAGIKPDTILVVDTTGGISEVRNKRKHWTKSRSLKP